MSTTYFISQLFGIMGATINIIAIRSKNKKNILFWFVIANLASLINLMLLKAFSGSTITAISCVQAFSLWIFEKQNKKTPNWMYVFFVVSSLIGFSISFSGIKDLLPTLAFCLYTISLLNKNNQIIRIFNFIIVILWTFYNFAIKSYYTFALDIVQLIIILGTIIKNYIIKNDT